MSLFIVSVSLKDLNGLSLFCDSQNFDLGHSEPIQSNGSFQKVVLLQEPTAVSLQCLVVSVYCAGDHHLG